MKRFEILGGLPAVGDWPLQFSATGMGSHSEGLVVQFFSSPNGNTWIGNFQRGLSCMDAVVDHPDGSSVLVIAGGDAYVIDVEGQSLKETFGGVFETITRSAEDNILVLGTSTNFEAIGPGGRIWRSGRVALDGIRGLTLDGRTLRGEAWNIDGVWEPFTLNVLTGEHSGRAF